MSFHSKSAVSHHPILKPIARVLNGTSPVVMFGAVETDSCSNFEEKVGRNVRVQSTGGERSEVWQGVLNTLGVPSEAEAANFSVFSRAKVVPERDVCAVGETWPRYANQPTGPGRTGPVEGIPLAGSDP